VQLLSSPGELLLHPGLLLVTRLFLPFNDFLRLGFSDLPFHLLVFPGELVD
jgi:hypothetical protein